MSGGQKTSTPKVPTPASATTSINGVPMSSAIYNKKTNTYALNGQMDAGDRQQYQQGQAGINGLFGKINEAINTSPEKKQQYIDATYMPVSRKINENYDQASAQGVGRFNAQGGLDSTSYADYYANNIEKNRSGALKDAYHQALLDSYDLPMMELQPLMTAGAFYQDAQNQPFTRMMQTLDPSFQGQNMATQQALQNWQATQQAKQQQKQNRGFLSGLFG